MGSGSDESGRHVRDELETNKDQFRSHNNNEATGNESGVLGEAESRTWKSRAVRERDAE